MDKYCEEEIKIKSSKFDRIDLPLIARTANPAEILKLFEYVILVVVNCPQKTVFIKRIMDLEEYVQVQLMYFIQKVMGSTEGENDENEAKKKELDVLKQEKKKLANQVSQLENELSVSQEEYAKLHSTCQQLQLENERIGYDLGRRVDNEVKETKAVELDLRVRLGEKDDLIFDLRKNAEKTKKMYEKEIAQLKDDLDIVNNKLVDAASNEKMIKQYKKRLESLTTFKQLSEDLQKQNESLTAKLASQQSEYDSLIKIKSNYNNLKELFEEEKLRLEALNFNLENKEKHLRKMEKSMNEYKDRALFFQKKVEELEAMDCQESSHLSEDSFMGHADKDYLNVVAGKPKIIGSLEQLDNMTKDFNRQKAIVEVKRMKLKKLKEWFKMSTEDFMGKLIENEMNLQQFRSTVELLQNDNYYLSEKITAMNDSLKDKENESFVHLQLIEELDALKASKLSLQSENKHLKQEKERLENSFSETKSKVLQHKSSITSKDSQLHEYQVKLKQAQDQILRLKENEEYLKSELSSKPEIASGSQEDLKIKSEVFSLKQELTISHAREEQLGTRVQDLISENEQLTNDYETKLKLSKESFEKSLKQKDDEMIKQIEESTSELMKHREQLVSKLQSEKRNSIMNFHRAMSIRELPLPMNKEVFRLREVLTEKEKEISKLQRSNKEIKNCWKQTAKLLKAVSKELGIETIKIEEAVRERVSI